LAKTGLFLLAGAIFVVFWLLNAPDSNITPNSDTACRITKVIDGDTLDLRCTGRTDERIRILGYDTPETYYAACPAEKRLGNQATNRLRQLAATTQVTRVERRGQDRYDRTLARIWLGGVDLAQTMVSENLAVRYNGGRRIDWCARLATSGISE